MGCGGSKKKEIRGDGATQDIEPQPKATKPPKSKAKKEKTVLLLGPGESGKSTLFKQLQIIQDSGGYTDAQLQDFIPNVRNNIVANMKILLGARSWIKTEADIAEEKMACVKVLEAANLNDWSDAIADAAEKLWAEAAIKEIYSKKDSKENYSSTHFQVSETCAYFFSEIQRIRASNYLPTAEDVLRARTRTTDVQRSSFKFDGILMEFIDVGGQRCERTKWMPLRDEATAVIYTAAISEYDQYLKEDKQTNRLTEALVLFTDVSNAFADKAVILFLNKHDLFTEKIKRVPFQIWDYDGDNSYEDVARFIETRFREEADQQKDLYIHFTCAVDTNNIRTIFDNVKSIVMKDAIAAIGLM